MKRAFYLFAVVALVGVACGPTIGDPCTTAADCLNQTCLNNASVPGGYCTTSCPGSAAECPTGSVCITNGISMGISGCFRSCDTALDCRNGYQCNDVRNNGHAVCIGPKGL